METQKEWDQNSEQKLYKSLAGNWIMYKALVEKAVRGKRKFYFLNLNRTRILNLILFLIEDISQLQTVHLKKADSK